MNARQMMVIVLRDEEEQVHRRHGLVEARVEGRPLEGLVRERLQPSYDRVPGVAEGGQQRSNGLRIVPGFMRPTVGQVGLSQNSGLLQEVIQPA